METEEVVRLIKESIADAVIEIKDLRGDGTQFEMRVESAVFANLSRLDQHRLVFTALQGRVGGVIQSLSLTTVAK